MEAPPAVDPTPTKKAKRATAKSIDFPATNISVIGGQPYFITYSGQRLQKAICPKGWSGSFATVNEAYTWAVDNKDITDAQREKLVDGLKREYGQQEIPRCPPASQLDIWADGHLTYEQWIGNLSSWSEVTERLGVDAADQLAKLKRPKQSRKTKPVKRNVEFKATVIYKVAQNKATAAADGKLMAVYTSVQNYAKKHKTKFLHTNPAGHLVVGTVAEGAPADHKMKPNALANSFMAKVQKHDPIETFYGPVLIVPKRTETITVK